MFEFPPAFRPLNNTIYNDAIDQRVKEPEMKLHGAYSLYAQLDLTSSDVGEFHTRLDRVATYGAGQAALVLCLFEPATDEMLVAIEATSNDGIIQPLNKSRIRIAHPYLNNIGVITEGYLLNTPEPSLTDEATPRELTEHAEPDTLTSAFATQGIILGRE